MSLAATFLFKLTTLNEYIDTFCLLITVLTCSVNILECIWKREKMFKFIERLEELIEKSNINYGKDKHKKSRIFFLVD